MIKNTINLKADWERYKDAIANHLIAKSEELKGKMMQYAPPIILRGSFETKVAPLMNYLAIECGTELQYGEYVEFETKPHWGPIEPLIRWAENNIQLHLIAVGVKFEGGTHATPTRKGTKKLRGSARDRAIKSFAYAVRASIAKKGTRAQYFMKRAIAECGLTAVETFDGVGGHYIIEASGYLQPVIDQLARQSGFSK